ncbi:hypothetical protein [Neobacillus muris]|uniref:hypothetical protein n=1 Tax=Neobacillus muris TaxID=2941334 RepID=UPI00203F62C9|nr:hypothetical protein [Neobacillus muris]
MDLRGTYTQSGVFVHNSYKDNIIIDKYNRVFGKMRGAKLEALRSENSEDAMTWNTFRTFQKIDPDLWLPKLFHLSFGEWRLDIVKDMKISLWKRFSSPVSLWVPERESEIDVMLENEKFVWIIEVKYKSDIKMSTARDEARNQVLRNIDIGSDYAKDKEFYFTLLILDEKHSPKGAKVVKEYQSNAAALKQALPHRQNGFIHVAGISLLKWVDIRDLFFTCEESAYYEDERFLSRLAKEYLQKRIPNN